MTHVFVIGYWLLVVGYYLLVIPHSPLPIGCWLLVVCLGNGEWEGLGNESFFLLLTMISIYCFTGKLQDYQLNSDITLYCSHLRLFGIGRDLLQSS
ncbi:hypothetical protein NJ959_15930 [Symplocastrum sp. BBK-W-15]|uniref:Uncharacterized protein n=1 Tax=Limnofasciculus baicalensis BBK-W-15 TaxID=2699891 RepID=A0AAE3GU46_9CYAN|nr:hypothetical protein [Limnofasciculus baicalensis]MCP2729923.1 hypothetical protein [Limnofasciculus baicalensis BBK-W-15]